MEGKFLGKPVRYRASGKRVLQGGFLRLHMIDAAKKPQYVADVFLGYDAHASDFIAHWLDSFGGAGARVVGIGKLAESQLIILFPYEDGTFRDTLEWNAPAKSWSLLIESQSKDSTWSTFASYVLTRVHH